MYAFSFFSSIEYTHISISIFDNLKYILKSKEKEAALYLGVRCSFIFLLSTMNDCKVCSFCFWSSRRRRRPRGAPGGKKQKTSTKPRPLFKEKHGRSRSSRSSPSRSGSSSSSSSSWCSSSFLLLIFLQVLVREPSCWSPRSGSTGAPERRVLVLVCFFLFFKDAFAHTRHWTGEPS